MLKMSLTPSMEDLSTRNLILFFAIMSVKLRNPPIASLASFLRLKDAQATHFPNEDMLVITLHITNFTIHKLLVDNESFANIILLLALEAFHPFLG